MKYYPNILIIKGTGRNIGKTVSACKIITKLSKNHETIGIKISPHFHSLNGDQKIIQQSEDFVIVDELNISKKDSSLMLQAGAKKVFYVQAKNDHLSSALDFILREINPENPVVIESGGLYNFVEPGILLFIKGPDIKKQEEIRKKSTVISLSAKELRNYNWDSIQFNNGKFTLYA